MLRFVDDYPVAQVAKALRSISMSEKAKTLVHAIATARNRAMSRIELARTIGSDSVNSCNTTLGVFARNLARALDPSLENVWRPASGERRDWVMFINYGPGRWTRPSKGEQDSWVFVMRETLAKALDRVEFAPYQALDSTASRIIREYLGANVDRTYLYVEADAQEVDETYVTPLSEIANAEQELEELEETEREAVILARLGQGVFRDALEFAWAGRCSVTGASVLPALVASHIKPWALSDNQERLDPDNGLLLVGTLDRLFDTGLITFEADGTIKISPLVPTKDYQALGLSSGLRLRKVPKGSKAYLAFHRAECFLCEPAS